MIDCYLAEEPAGDVSLEILDAQGEVIRRFSSATPGEVTSEMQGMRAPVLVSAGTPRLPQTAGMHRFTWDLRYPGAWSENARAAGRGGPMAVPGTYQARLVAGEWSATERFQLLIDPRIADDGVTVADLEEQLALNLSIRDAISEARLVLAEVRRAMEGLRDDRRARRLSAIEARLATADTGGIRYAQPMLLAQLQYLSRMTARADQKPGKDAHQRYEQLRGELDELLEQFHALVEDSGT